MRIDQDFDSEGYLPAKLLAFLLPFLVTPEESTVGLHTAIAKLVTDLLAVWLTRVFQ